MFVCSTIFLPIWLRLSYFTPKIGDIGNNEENEYSAQRTIEKVKIFGAVLELQAKQNCQFSPFTNYSIEMNSIET
jgi:hypothetical protein